MFDVVLATASTIESDRNTAVRKNEAVRLPNRSTVSAVNKGCRSPKAPPDDRAWAVARIESQHSGETGPLAMNCRRLAGCRRAQRNNKACLLLGQDTPQPEHASSRSGETPGGRDATLARGRGLDRDSRNSPYQRLRSRILRVRTKITVCRTNGTVARMSAPSVHSCTFFRILSTFTGCWDRAPSFGIPLIDDRMIDRQQSTARFAGGSRSQFSLTHEVAHDRVFFRLTCGSPHPPSKSIWSRRRVGESESERFRPAACLPDPCRLGMSQGRMVGVDVP